MAVHISSFVDGAEIAKIDSAATLGLLGTNNSLAYRVHEIEKDIHNDEKWFGLAGAENAEVHRADRITLIPEPFVIDAGNMTWGSWLQILGSSDTPLVSGMVKYDLHKILVASHERNNAFHCMQIVFGESADIAAKLIAEDFTEVPFLTPSAPGGQNEPLSFKDERSLAGEKAWARIMVKGANTGTLSFYFGLHEYQG